MLNALRLKSKLLIVGLAVTLALVGIAAYDALAARSAMYQQRAQLLQAIVQAAATTLAHYGALERAGKLTPEEARHQGKEALRAVRYLGREYVFIRDMTGRSVLLPAKPEKEGKGNLDEADAKGKRYVREFIEKAREGGGFVDYHFPRPGAQAPARKTSYVMPIADWGWVIGTGMYVDDIEAKFWKETAGTLAGVLAFCVVVCALIMVVGRSVLRQVGGEPAEALAVMHKVADGDLTQRTGCEHRDSMVGALDGLIQHLAGMMGKISGQVLELQKAARAINETACEVAVAAEGEALSADTMARAIEELTLCVAQISDNARDTEGNAAKAANLAKDGEQHVEAAAEEMSQIAVAVQGVAVRIGALGNRASAVSAIAALIKDIAAQTNLLALNAAIEAARAGEQGAGFAVVADEVRSLADRTAQATAQIDSVILAIQDETTAAAKAIHQALPQVAQGQKLTRNGADSLKDIAQGARQALARIALVAEAADEQRNASSRIAQQVERVAQQVSHTSVSMKTMATAANELDRIASTLDTMVGRFRL